MHGVQTAVVVGLTGNPIHTDRDHRIKVQFHWQRGANASHRLGHTGGNDAPATEASGTWVRVGQSVAGANWGAVFTPRLGQEVLVQFVAGDIDRPIVTGALYNGQGSDSAQGNQQSAGAATSTGNAPAWFPGTEQAQAASGALQGHQHTAVLAGYKSQELSASQSGSGGYNQIVFDDSAEAGRIELSSTSAQTRLQLGHLIQQTDNQRLQPRGHGIDLSTQAWGALRAGSGLLLSTHRKPGSQNPGHHIDSQEPTNQLEQSQQLLHTLAESSQKHNAKTIKEAEPKKLAVSAGMTGQGSSLRAVEVMAGAGVAAVKAAPQTTEATETPAKVYSEQFCAVDEVSGKALPDKPYRLELANGSVLRGRTDAQGLTKRVTGEAAQSVKLFWEPESSAPPAACTEAVEGC